MQPTYRFASILRGEIPMQLRRPVLVAWLVVLAVLAAGAAMLTPGAGQAGLPTYKAKKTETSFTSADTKIKVWRFTPAEGKGPWPGVVLLYGLDALDEFPKGQLLYTLVAGKTADKGFV